MITTKPKPELGLRALRVSILVRTHNLLVLYVYVNDVSLRHSVHGLFNPHSIL